MRRTYWAVAVALLCVFAAGLWAVTYVSFVLTTGAVHVLEMLVP